MKLSRKLKRVGRLCLILLLRLSQVVKHALQCVILRVRHPAKSMFVEEFCGALAVCDGENLSPSGKQAAITGNRKL